MDNDIAYKIITPTGFLLICKCKSKYFYLSKFIIPKGITSTTNPYIVVKYCRATCTNCKSTTNAYNTDKIIKIGEVTWITV